MVNKRNILTLCFLLTPLLSGCGQDAAAPGSEATSSTASQAAPAIPDGITLIEEFKGEPGSIAIPYTKYRLDNGLTVVLHEDHSCLLYTSPSPRDKRQSRMPSSA